MDLSIVIPVYNEQDNIFAILSEIHHSLKDKVDYEVIYVNDGSTDKTLKRLKLARSEYPRLRIISHTHRCGQSTAIRTGVKMARSEWIVTLDGDGQNDPEDIMMLYQRMIHADKYSGQNHSELALIAGWRKDRQDSWSKRIASKIANRVRSRLLKDDTPDTGCGLKLFRRSVFLDLPYFDHMHRFLPALFIRAGTQVMSVPVNHRARQQGESKYGINNRLWVGLVDLFGVMWLQRRVQHPEIIEEEVQH